MHTRTLTAAVVGVHLAIAGAIVGTVVSVAPAHSGTPNLPSRTAWMRTLCPAEDSTDCAWNAAAEGNGIGHSFYSVTRHVVGPYGHRIGRVTCVYYVKPADARRWDDCHLLPKGAPTHP